MLAPQWLWTYVAITKLPLVAVTGTRVINSMQRCVFVTQMDSDALESSLGGTAQQRTPLEVLTQIEGPATSFQQDALDYFCYTQLASQVSQPYPCLGSLKLVLGVCSFALASYTWVVDHNEHDFD